MSQCWNSFIKNVYAEIKYIVALSISIKPTTQANFNINEWMKISLSNSRNLQLTGHIFCDHVWHVCVEDYLIATSLHYLQGWSSRSNQLTDTAFGNFPSNVHTHMSLQFYAAQSRVQFGWLNWYRQSLQFPTLTYLTYACVVVYSYSSPRSYLY